MERHKIRLEEFCSRYEGVRVILVYQKPRCALPRQQSVQPSLTLAHVKQRWVCDYKEKIPMHAMR